jgi:hypothetical protein
VAHGVHGTRVRAGLPHARIVVRRVCVVQYDRGLGQAGGPNGASALAIDEPAVRRQHGKVPSRDQPHDRVEIGMQEGIRSAQSNDQRSPAVEGLHDLAAVLQAGTLVSAFQTVLAEDAVGRGAAAQLPGAEDGLTAQEAPG